MPFLHLSVALGLRSCTMTLSLTAKLLGCLSPTCISAVCSNRCEVQGCAKERRVHGTRLRSSSAGVLDVVVCRVLRYVARKRAMSVSRVASLVTQGMLDSFYHIFCQPIGRGLVRWNSAMQDAISCNKLLELCGLER